MRSLSHKITSVTYYSYYPVKIRSWTSLDRHLRIDIVTELIDNRERVWRLAGGRKLEKEEVEKMLKAARDGVAQIIKNRYQK